MRYGSCKEDYFEAHCPDCARYDERHTFEDCWDFSFDPDDWGCEAFTDDWAQVAAEAEERRLTEQEASDWDNRK